MKSPGTIAIALLALTTIGGAALAWHQYQELVDLRASAMDKNERANWQKRVWDLEKSNRELADQLAALRAENGDVDGVIAAATNDPQPPRDRGPRGGPGARGGRGQGGAQQVALRELLAKPEVQAIIDQQRKLAIEDRYSSLIRNLNLTPEQSDKLKTLLAERQNSAQDVLAVAREQGVDPRSEEFRKLVADSRNEVNNSIKALLGESGFEQLQTYEQTLPQRAVVDQIQRRLTNSGTPMTPTQADQLVGILAANAPKAEGDRRGGAVFGGDFGGGRGRDIGALAGAFMGGGGLAGGGPSTPITPAAINQAQGVLSQPQLAVLQQMQQQQQQTQQLRQLVTQTMSANSPAPNNGTAGGTPTTAPAPGGGNRRRGGGR